MKTAFLNRDGYIALASLALAYLVLFATDVGGGIGFVFPVAFAVTVWFLIAAFRSEQRMGIAGTIALVLVGVLSLPIFLLSLIVLFAPFISFS